MNKEGDSFQEEAKPEQAETVDSFTVEEADGKTHHFETNEETGDAEYKKKNTVDADAKIPTAIKVLVIVLIVAVGGLVRFPAACGRRCAEQKSL